MIIDTVERIRAHLKLQGVTKKGFAEKAGLHPNTLQGIEDPAWNPSAATLIALEAQLPVTDGENPRPFPNQPQGADLPAQGSSSPSRGKYAGKNPQRSGLASSAADTARAA